MSVDPTEDRLAALPEPDLDDPDNPEWTDEMFAQAKRDEHLLPPEVKTMLRRGRGRPKLERTKTEIKLRIDPDVVEAFKATGPGWQTRINDALKAAVSHGLG